MNRKLFIALTVSAALAAPLAAQAQQTSASSTVVVNGNVDKACVIGQPTTVTLAIGNMTDNATGRITAALASSNEAVSTEIASAWCNTPSTLSLDGAPMALTPTPAYSTPSGFARLVTYDANLTGWSAALLDRPLVGDAAKTVTAANAHASPLELVISRLAALDAGGTTENALAVLEAGAYSGTVVISASANP